MCLHNQTVSEAHLCLSSSVLRLICSSKSVEGPDVPLQNTKTKSSPDDYSKAPGVEVHAYTYTNMYSQTGCISIFVVFLCLSFHSQQGPQLLLAHTPLMIGYWDCFVGTFHQLLFQPDGSTQFCRNQAYLHREPEAWDARCQRAQKVFWGLATPSNVSPPRSKFPNPSPLFYPTVAPQTPTGLLPIYSSTGDQGDSFGISTRLENPQPCRVHALSHACWTQCSWDPTKLLSSPECSGWGGTCFVCV